MPKVRQLRLEEAVKRFCRWSKQINGPNLRIMPERTVSNECLFNGGLSP
ncbi:MAG: hypothetical protein ACYS6K_14740 [Planctomycetota bacterium]